MTGGMYGKGEACVAGETAPAADGTHPTGMLSCLKVVPCVKIIKRSLCEYNIYQYCQNRIVKNSSIWVPLQLYSLVEMLTVQGGGCMGLKGT